MIVCNHESTRNAGLLLHLSLLNMDIDNSILPAKCLGLYQCCWISGVWLSWQKSWPHAHTLQWFEPWEPRADPGFFERWSNVDTFFFLKAAMNVNKLG